MMSGTWSSGPSTTVRRSPTVNTDDGGTATVHIENCSTPDGGNRTNSAGRKVGAERNN
ncbi:MAG: hypothetical protein IH986_15440 [Planctomycetes bacterium]|nr:hypothetical protein [Planctomycetota bacterium]